MLEVVMERKELIETALRESKDFAKEIRYYLYDISKERPLTKQEQALFESTHEIHVRTNDAILLLDK
jgi:hypothetical protein